MNDIIETKELTVTIQENGIIRAPNGRLIARLVDDIKFESEHLEQRPETNKGDVDVRCELFEKELEKLINTHCQENQSNTPDFILAKYMKMSLDAFNYSVERRETWYGRSPHNNGMVEG